MKSFAWIPIALVAGLLIGAWGPRSELRKCREEVKELEELLKSGGQARSSAFNGVTRFLRLPEETATRDAPRAEPESAGDQPDQVAPSNSVVVSAGNSNITIAVATEDSGETEDGGMRERLEKAADLWRVRSDVARSSFVNRAGLDADGEEEFDVVMAAMNMQLRERIAFWAEEMENSDEITEETGVRMMNDMSSVLVTTYEEMDSKMPQGWRGEGETTVKLTDFVDPMVAEPLIKVEDRIDNHRGRRGPPWRRRPAETQ